MTNYVDVTPYLWPCCGSLRQKQMGQAMTSETLSISGGDGYRYWVGLTMKPFKRGCKKTMYKGVLLGHGPRQWEKVVTKAFTDIQGTKELWTFEVQKSYLTKKLAAEFILQFPGECKIRVVVPGIVQMDKVSNLNKWLASRKGKRSLDQDEWISIEELIPGHMVRYCPWTAEHHKEEHADSKHLQTFSHFTYKYSDGQFVACDFQGVCQNRDSLPYYIFTDSTIHSLNKRYGLFDKGEYGMTEFFKLHKCTNICKNWPKPTPLTPPPPFSVACAQRFEQMIPPYFENIIFQSSSAASLDTDDPYATDGSSCRPVSGIRRRHASDHQTRQQSRPTQIAADLTNASSLRQRRSSYYENVQGLNQGEPLPPTYESLGDISTENDSIKLNNNHAVLTASNSCPMLDINHSTNVRPPIDQWGRSRTYDEPDTLQTSTPLYDEESRLRSWSENTLNMNLLQRRLVHNMHANGREMDSVLPPLMFSSRNTTDAQFTNR
ncbi:uncharacterized protein LOC106059634 isoform X2 [Biomphalaria glabrata]|uniref:Uncharacterized protein LOC106059634 isoform X2 n=1 Tax=Biomphalaria glabrata TaxID=6526 RepID=A0A2C9L7Q6_BIOGL|nr:uncharacterized protein LOC106059634 isoform X2 [Biomphalaria glabrata]